MKISLYRAFLISLTAILVVMYSCNTDSDGLRKRDIIPDKDLVPILTDLYLTDGLLTIPAVRTRFSEKDSITNYMDVMKGHGYTIEALDRTIEYYLQNKAEKLEELHKSVIENLTILESRLETEMSKTDVPSLNLWMGQTTIAVPESGLYNSIPVDIQISDTGMYVLSFDAIIYRDDESINPRADIFFWHSGSDDEGVRDYWNSVELIRDNAIHNYSVSKRLTDPSFTHIRGWIVEHNPQQGRWQKHVRVSQIRLTKASMK